MSNSITNRLVVKPQLARKQRVINIPKSARTQQSARPTAVKTIIINNRPPATKQIVQPVSKQIVPPPNKNRFGIQAVVQKQRTLKKQEIRKSKGVRYVTQDVSDYEREKIRNMRGRGTGKILLIIGNGPSINEVPLDMLRDHPSIDTMSINRPDERLWPTTYWSFFDQSQLRRHNQLWQSYNGIIFNSTSIKHAKDNSIKVKNLGNFGFSLDLIRGLHIGRSSVYAAMQLGLWLNYKHIYIFGCDMCSVNGQTHFYGVNPDAPPDTRLDRFAKEAEYYADAAEKLDETTRNRFTFCSSYNQYQFVDKFGRLDHKEAVPTILGIVNGAI